jgi:hypothetical protein
MKRGNFRKTQEDRVSIGNFMKHNCVILLIKFDFSTIFNHFFNSFWQKIVFCTKDQMLCLLFLMDIRGIEQPNIVKEIYLKN